MRIIGLLICVVLICGPAQAGWKFSDRSDPITDERIVVVTGRLADSRNLIQIQCAADIDKLRIYVQFSEPFYRLIGAGPLDRWVKLFVRVDGGEVERYKATADEIDLVSLGVLSKPMFRMIDQMASARERIVIRGQAASGEVATFSVTPPKNEAYLPEIRKACGG